MYCVSLEPPTFGFPLESGPDALPLSHGDLDASSTIFFNDTATTEIYTLSLHDALPIYLFVFYMGKFVST